MATTVSRPESAAPPSVERPRVGRIRAAIGLVVVTATVVATLPLLPSPADAGTSLVTSTVSNSASWGGMTALGRGAMAEFNGLTVMLYQDGNQHGWAYFRDPASGASTHLALPDGPVVGGWPTASYSFSGNQLMVLSGGGRLFRQYELAGSPMPTTATLTDFRTFGDSDSRAGGLLNLASGGLVAQWHQQGATGPQGLWVAYRSPAGTWTTLPVLQFMPTRSSKETLVQHPVDGSIWIFSDPDAWSSIGAVHLTETAEGLRVDWTNAAFISSADGTFDPDPEYPDLAAAPDPSTGTIALAYQTATRKMFSVSPVVTGSYPAVARIGTDGAKSFLSFPVYVERISYLGLVVRPGETWLVYRPISESTLTFTDLYASVYANGAWGAPMRLGTTLSTWESVAYGVSRAEFAASRTQYEIDWWAPPTTTATSTALIDPTTSTTTSTTSTTTSTTTAPTKKCQARRCR